MNDKYLEKWAETLPLIRQARNEAFKNQIHDNGPNFKVQEAYDILMDNMDKLLKQWWQYEKDSWAENPSPEKDLVRSSMVQELDNVIELEMDSMLMDVEMARDEVQWNDDELAASQKDLERFTQDLKGNYSLKIEGLLGKEVQPAHDIPMSSTPPQAKVRVVHSGGSSGMGMLIMLLIGLILGGAAAFYFWEQGTREREEFRIDQQRLMDENSAIVDSMTMLSETYFQLVHGKIMTIPQLQRKINPIKKSYAKKKKTVEKEYLRKKTNLMRKIPAGDKLDRALFKLEGSRDNKLARLKAQERSQLEPYMKQLRIHQELLEQNEIPNIAASDKKPVKKPPSP